MKALVGAFNQEKALVGAFTVITNLRITNLVSSSNEDTTNNNTRDLDWRLLGDEASKSALNRKTDSLKNKIKGFRLIWTKTLLVVDSLLDIQKKFISFEVKPNYRIVW